jgi:transposase-like protein
MINRRPKGLFLVDVPSQKDQEKFAGKEESERTLSAFEYYYNLGPKRSYTKTARRFGMHRQGIYFWARKFHWQDRIIERNNLMAEKLETATTNHAITVKVRYSNALSDIIRDYLAYVKEMKTMRNVELRAWNQQMKDFKAGKISMKPDPKLKPRPFSAIKDIKDLETVVKLEMLMLGESTERGERVIETKDHQLETQLRTDEKLRELVRQTWRQFRVVK